MTGSPHTNSLLARTISPKILALAEAFPVIAILGPTKSGKTTLAKLLFPQYKYLSLEDLSLRDDAKRDPKGFLQLYQTAPGVIIDEFQHVPELLSYIQLIVDENRRPGYFILTGSQNFLMNQAISQTLAGRIALTTLLPLTIGELRPAHKLPTAIETLAFTGAYPELYVNLKLGSYEFYFNYTKTYVERDLRDLKQIQNLSTFMRFMKLCAARVGQIVNISALADDAEINVATAKAWLSLLESSFLIFFLQPYATQFTRRLIKAPKLFFYDTGLASYLLGLETAEDFRLSPYRGQLVESLIITELTKLYYNAGKQPPLYFLRDKTGHEIDCLIETARTILPIEIKARMTANLSAFDGINFWHKVYAQSANEQSKQLQKGLVIFAGNATEERTYGKFLSWRDLTDLQQVLPAK